MENETFLVGGWGLDQGQFMTANHPDTCLYGEAACNVGMEKITITICTNKFCCSILSLFSSGDNECNLDYT
jgi:hypothetical protein